MSTEKFSKAEAVTFGWETMKSNFWFLVGVLIMGSLIPFVPYILAEAVKKNIRALYIIFKIIEIALELIISLGMIKIALKLCDKQKPAIKDLFSCVNLFPEYLISSVIYALIILGGLVLLIVPGIIGGIKFQFIGYFIVEKGAGPIEALKRSAAITRGAKWDLFLFALLLMLINLVGLLALIIGLFATIPVTMMANAFVYRKLLSQVETATAQA